MSKFGLGVGVCILYTSKKSKMKFWFSSVGRNICTISFILVPAKGRLINNILIPSKFTQIVSMWKKCYQDFYIFSRKMLLKWRHHQGHCQLPYSILSTNFNCILQHYEPCKHPENFKSLSLMSRKWQLPELFGSRHQTLR